MIKNRVLFFAVVLIAQAGLACSSGGGGANSQAEATRLQKYVQQAVPKLNTLEARHGEMMREIGQSLRKGANKNYQYDRDKVLGIIAAMRGDVENMQKDFRAMTIPKAGESFAGNIMQLTVNELVFLDRLEAPFKSESMEIGEGAWSELSANAALTPYQKNLLVGAMMKVSGLSQNANAGGN